MGWIPIGPISTRSIALDDHKALSGRVRGIAVAAAGSRVYVAAANGGVFRSDDGGATWTSTTDNWFVDVTSGYASPLACGAVAVDPTNADRVFVGSGDEYGGLGPLRSDTGGLGATPWTIEPVAPGSPSLLSQRFFAVAIDPNDTERAVAATSAGVYRREPDGVGGHYWVHQPASTACTDVVAVSVGGVTTFYLARGDTPTEAAAVLVSGDGAAWTTVGVGFPASGVTGVRLAVQPGNANLVYALQRDASYTSGALFRLDLPDTQWRAVAGLPPGLFNGQPPIVVAVDPNHAERVFFGSVLLYRAAIGSSGVGPSLAYTMTPTNVTGIHNDHWELRYVGSDSSRLWFGCDGGAYFTDSADGAVSIASKNVGLATIEVEKIGLHPTEEAVMFLGSQDNGIIRYDGDEVWRNLTNMDGGHVLVNWADPYKVLANADYDAFQRATDGGQDLASWTSVNIGVVTNSIYPPVAGTPPDPADLPSADRVAVGLTRIYLSDTFGGGWYSIPHNDATDDLPGGDTFGAVVFASSQILYAGTHTGQAYRYAFAGGAWSRSLLPAIPTVTNVGVLVMDPADPLTSFYLAAFAASDYRRVWHWNGTAWEQRSGPSAGAATSLTDLPFQALTVDPMHAERLYAANLTGLWSSIDSGSDWSRFDDGLPRAPILDLRIHPVARTLFAATYGRGVWARDLAIASPPAVELYVRDTALDLGKHPTVDGLPDPLAPGQHVYHWEGPDIKADAPVGGVYQLTPPISDFQFVDQLADMSGAVETTAVGSPTVVNRVYVQVHNRGLGVAGGHVMLLLTNASTTLHDLPSGYTANVQGMTPLTTLDWSTLGFQPFSNLRVGHPRVLQFDLPSTLLPPPAGLPGNHHWCVLALVHGGVDDPFTSTEVHVDTLTVNDRKATNKNLTIVPIGMAGMIGGGGMMGAGRPWAPLRLNAPSGMKDLGDLVFDVSAFRGEVHVVVPEVLERHLVAGALRVPPDVKDDQRRPHHAKDVERRIFEVQAFEKARQFDARWCQQMVSALSAVKHAPARVMAPGKQQVLLARPRLAPGSWATLFVSFRPDPRAKVGDRFRVTAFHRAGGRTATGGYTWEIRIVK